MTKNPHPIAIARDKAGLSQQAASTAAGFSISIWSQWERGTKTPSDRALLAIAKVLRCRVADLLPGDTGRASA